LNEYVVLIAYTDPNQVVRRVGDRVLLKEKDATPLIKLGRLALLQDLTQKLVDLRYDGQRLFLYNVRTGARIGEVTVNGIVGTLIGDSFGDHYGNVQGNVSGSLSGNTTGLNFGDVTTYDADGAIALLDKSVLLNGALATCQMTLADGTEGQEITVKAINVTEVCSLTPANLRDGAIINFTDANSVVRLVFDGTNWNVVSTYLTVAVA
jgi:hypothetical protein